MGLGHVAVRRPRLVLAAWGLFFLVCLPLAVFLGGAVKAGGFVDSRSASAEAQQLSERVFGDPPNQLLVTLASGRGVTDSDRDRAVRAAGDIAGVTSVVDARTVPALRSDSGRTQVVEVNFSTDNTTTQNSVPALRSAVSAALEGTGVESHVTGAAALDYDLNIQSQKDALRAEMIAFPLLIVILLLVYRAVGPVLVTLATAAVCLVGTQGLGTLIAWTVDTSNFYTTAGSLIGLAVSVDYCLFLLSRYREGIEEGSTPDAALREATRTAGHAVRFGGLCVLAALFSLFWARNMVFGSIAGGGAVVTVIAIAAVGTLVPALVTVLGDKVFLGRLPGFSRRPTASARVTVPLALRRPGLVALGLLIPLGIATVPLTSLTLRVPVASASILPAGADSRLGVETVNDEMDSRALFPTSVVVSGTTDVGGLVDELSTAPGVLTVVGPGDPAAAVVGVPVTGQEGDATYSRILLTSTGDPDSAEAHDMVAAVRDIAGAWSARTGRSTAVAGATAGGRDFDLLVESSIPWIVGLVVAGSLVLLGWSFRSVVLPVLAVCLNGLVVAAAIGILAVGWKAATGNPVNSVTPLVVFAIVFGLSMDYMVLMASRMKEERVRGRDHTGAVALGLARTSRLVISAAIIMIGVFLSFLVAEISIVAELGLGLAVAVAVDALLVRPFLLPALLGLIGDRAWGRRTGPWAPGAGAGAGDA
ncbi:MMPL family transporter [Corynebacterium bovis]|uniref:MMPL family transporter n=1 Tax=Corynebacterium bovis TaxID=36808 RepID=UPI00254C0654|nr:MMPL family transporter [Corynebacterium bovis]MDK8511402.1 MMPL family transporter [Corynebacterium bovis]